MKKIFLLAASVALVFASCVKTTTVGPDAEDQAQLTVKISGGAATRSIDGSVTDPTTTGTIKLLNGTIFVFSATGEYVWSENLNSTNAVGGAFHTEGQKLTQNVPVNSRVFVVGNVKGAVATVFGSATPTLTQVKAGVEAISATGLITADSWINAPLANTGDAVSLQLHTANAAADDYLADVTLAPVISRLELVAVEGGSDTDTDAAGPDTDSDGAGTITGFTVTGIFVDSYYPEFTYTGFGSGTAFQQGTDNTNFAGALQDVNVIGGGDDWAAADVSGVMTATAGTSKVWGYNVAPSASATDTTVPRFIVRLENVMFDADGAGATESPEAVAGVHFLTVAGYTGVTAFERGKIYRIGTASNKFTFNRDDLDVIPNPPTGPVPVYVSVEIEEWVLETPGAILM